MGLTGLLLCGFAVSHLAGNFLLLVSAEAFNTYAYTLTSSPLIYVAEAGLLAIFLTHMFLALKLQKENNDARPEKYYMRKHTGRGATFASSTMIYTGIILFIYLIFHIWHMKFGPHYDVTYNGVEMRDLYKLVIEYFANPLSVFFYVFAMTAFGVHLSHGFWSAFQSFGFNHPTYTPLLKKASVGFGILMTVGFSIFPIWAFVTGGAQ